MANKFESTESAFNFAVEYLKSIKQSLDAGKFSAVRQDIDGWYHWLRAAFREVALMTTDDEDKEFEEKFKEINRLMNSSEDKIKKKREILLALDNLEIKLRKKIQQKGMGLPRTSDPRFAVLKR